MKKKNNTVVQAFSMVSQFGISMVVPIAMCCVIGYFLDRWLGTGFWFILLFFVGAIAGGRNVYISVRTIMKLDERKDNPYVSRISKDK